MFIKGVCLYFIYSIHGASADLGQDHQQHISPAQQDVQFDIKYYNPEEVLEEHYGYEVATEEISEEMPAYIEVSPDKTDI